MRKGQGQDHEPISRASSSCAACKLLKRRCSKDCIFAPYFRADEPKKFAKVHKVFGASNVSKILHEVPLEHRHDAVLSLSYEAEARLLDPVYGCLGPIAFLQHRMAQLQHDLALARARLARYASFNGGPAPPPLPLPVESSDVGPPGAVSEEIQIYATLPIISSEIIAQRNEYDGVFMGDKVDNHMPIWQNHSSYNSELLSQNSCGFYDDNEFGQVPLLPL